MNDLHRRPPKDCPVCGAQLALTRLSCEGCETELSGWFASCEFCVLDDGERELLRLFLSSRGNLKDLQRHLGVSYPTARARFDDLLARMGLRPDGVDEAEETGSVERLVVLEALARGELDIDEAEQRLGGAEVAGDA